MPFDPSSLSGKELWFRAKDLGSGSVTSWADQSGNSRNLTGTGGTVVTAATPAGGKAISGTSMAYSPASFGLNMTSGGELWVVLKSNGGSGPTSWEYGTDSLNSHYTYGGDVYDDFGTNTRKSFTPNPQVTSGWHVYRVVSNGSNWAAYINNNVQSSTSSSTMAWRSAPVVLEAFSGQVAEILLVRALTTTEATDLMSYFTAEHGPFLPAMQTRYDANALTGLSDGDSVSTWPDTSGNGYTASPGSAGTYKTNITPSGKPVVRFAGNYYTTVASAQAGQHTCAAVARPTGSGTARTLIAATGGFGPFELRFETDNKLALLSSGRVLVGTSPSALSTTNFSLILVTASNSAWNMRINGALVATGGGVDYVWSGNRELGGAAGNTLLTGDVAEIMTWERVLGTTEIPIVENFLNDKWLTIPVPTVSTGRWGIPIN